MAQSVGSRGKYQYITDIDSTCYNGSASIDAIIIHHWGEDNSTWQGVINSCCTPSRQASAHYVLDAGKVACLIPPGRRAWHVESNYYQGVMKGIYDINSHTIGIECNPYATDAMVETLCQLIADLWIDYGKVPLYGHKQFMATQCPGRYYSKLSAINARATKIYNDIVNGTESEDDWMAKLTDDEITFIKRLYAQSKEKECSAWATEEFTGAIEAGITTGERPQDVLTRQEGAIMVYRSVKNK